MVDFVILSLLKKGKKSLFIKKIRGYFAFAQYDNLRYFAFAQYDKRRFV